MSHCPTCSQEIKEESSTRVFVNGCFDILHVGHVRLLEYAASMGELTVAINSDSSIRRLKGEGRPIVCQAERAEMLAALKFVSTVLTFNERTPAKLLRSLYHAKVGPHIVVKGSEYNNAAITMHERPIIEDHGGMIVYFDMLPKRSTTRVVNHALHAAGGKKILDALRPRSR